jgi:hypothetical protein
MKYFTTKLILTLTLIIISNSIHGQSGEIKIQFIGNCGLYMTDGKEDIYIDFPYKSGAYGYMTYEITELDSVKEDAIYIFTHKHNDHHSSKNLKKVLKEKKGKKYGPWNIKKLEKLGNSIEGFSIEAYKTKHRFSLRHYSYMITWHGKKIYLSGDTESAETIAKMTGMEWAFVPGWIIMDAIEKNIKIDTKMIGVYHLYPGQKVNNESPEKIKLLNVQKEVISIQY